MDNPVGNGLPCRSASSPPAVPERNKGNLRSAEWKVRTGFALALAVLVVIGGMSYFSLVRLHEDRVRVEHTQQVITALRLEPAIVAEAEAAVRGYVITGHEDFLEPYQRALSSVHDDLGNLRRLTADNRLQQTRLDALEPLVAERLSLLQQTVELRRQQGLGAAQQHIASGRGEQLHTRIRALLAEMEATEESLLQERATRAHHAGSAVRTVIITGIALAFVFVAVALFVISQDFAGSRRAQAALQEAHDLLEARVQQRTAELARTNEALHDSETRLAGIINSAMDAIITVDEQQRIVLFNPAAEKMFGHRAADVIGESLDVCIPQRFRAAHAQHHRAFGDTGLTRRHMRDLSSISGLRASGEEFPIEASISKVDLGGRKLFTAILRDITERKRAEAALRQSEERLQRVTEGMTEGLVISDINGELAHWNPAAIEMHGFTSREVWRRQLPEMKD
ncbi:MAG TPA: CHASE3 domain-containing protein, partial [Terriglobales bacterium]|nr:CHASE3 domain-containing protein [Terriglobales bacterium]